MLQKHYSLVVAEYVVNLILSDERVEGLDGCVECYQNGREQGFQIRLWDSEPYGTKAVFIAQQRTSDAILVAYGTYAMQSISEDAYRNAECASTPHDAVDLFFAAVEHLKAKEKANAA